MEDLTVKQYSFQGASVLIKIYFPLIYINILAW